MLDRPTSPICVLIKGPSSEKHVPAREKPKKIKKNQARAAILHSLASDPLLGILPFQVLLLNQLFPSSALLSLFLHSLTTSSTPPHLYGAHHLWVSDTVARGFGFAKGSGPAIFILQQEPSSSCVSSFPPLFVLLAITHPTRLHPNSPLTTPPQDSKTQLLTCQVELLWIRRLPSTASRRQSPSKPT